jgi:ABC transport system ATP-binding/permease protein
MNEEADKLFGLKVENLSSEKIREIQNGISTINDFYIDSLAQADALLTKQVEQFQSDPQRAAMFQAIKRRFYNEDLAGIGTGKGKKNKIALENGKLIRLVDPVYASPAPQGFFDYSTHFYSPKKHFLGKYFDTFLFNISVVWFMCVILFITLYFNTLKKLADLFSFS